MGFAEWVGSGAGGTQASSTEPASCHPVDSPLEQLSALVPLLVRRNAFKVCPAVSLRPCQSTAGQVQRLRLPQQLGFAQGCCRPPACVAAVVSAPGESEARYEGTQRGELSGAGHHDWCKSHAAARRTGCGYSGKCIQATVACSAFSHSSASAASAAPAGGRCRDGEMPVRRAGCSISPVTHPKA